jgi:uncharacterized protein
MSVYESSIQQLSKMLGQLDLWLEAGEAYAKKRSFDPSVLLGARIAPDQYPLLRQVQTACDTAKFTAVRLTGKEAPKHPDEEKTFAELHARIKSCRDWLGTITPADLAKAENRLVELPFLEGKVIRGEDYLLEFAQPNFYFHVTTAYAILRHNGVELGKRDYIGSLTVRDK